LFISDNPDVDIRGANIFKQHLATLNSDQINLKSSDFKSSNTDTVESILVSTGVYNSNNDVHAHLARIFDEKKSLTETEKIVIKQQLSGDDYFVDYFNNKHNTPDLIVGNVSHAVDYILKRNV